MFWRRRYTGSIYFLDSWLAVTFLIYLYKQLNYLMKTEWCLVTKSCLTLCDPMDCSPPGSSVHGISQARILEWDAISFSNGYSRPRDWTQVSCIGRWILYYWAIREAGLKHNIHTQFRHRTALRYLKEDSGKSFLTFCGSHGATPLPPPCPALCSVCYRFLINIWNSSGLE